MCMHIYEIYKQNVRRKWFLVQDIGGTAMSCTVDNRELWLGISFCLIEESAWFSFEASFQHGGTSTIFYNPLQCSFFYGTPGFVFTTTCIRTWKIFTTICIRRRENNKAGWLTIGSEAACWESRSSNIKRIRHSTTRLPRIMTWDFILFVRRIILVLIRGTISARWYIVDILRIVAMPFLLLY